MRVFRKSKSVLITNILLACLLIISSLILYSRPNESFSNLGFDIYLIFAILLVLFSIPSIITIIRYLILPNLLVTINKDELIIHKRKKEYRINSCQILSVSKEVSIADYIKLDVGNLKIFLKDRKKPIYIRYINEKNSLYDILDIFVLKNIQK